MDAVVKQMVESYEAGLKAQEGMVRDAALLAPARAVIARMKALADEPGVDLMKFQERAAAEGLLEQYAAAMAKLGEAMMAAAQAAGAEAEAAAQKVDIKDVDITNLELILAPHRAAYKSVTTPRMKAAYEALFALGAECKTIPEFNRRAEAEGHYAHLGLAAAWDTNENTYRLEVKHRQPDMVTYALDALETVRAQPFPESIAYALTRLALLNERKMARRWNEFAPFNAFTGELSSYLILNHTEDQRRKVVNAYELQRSFTGRDLDAGTYHPHYRILMTLDDENKRREWGADYLGVIPFLRAGWFTDAALTPAEKQAYADRKEFPRPPASPFPYRTGPVGGVDIVAASVPFAGATDAPYAVNLEVVNGAGDARALDPARGLKIWVFGEEGVVAELKVADVPASLAPGERLTVAGDLFAWGLPREEKLFLVAFELGVGAPFPCDLAVKYGDPANVTPAFIPNFYLEPFRKGVATEPTFVFPHRPYPSYPFPRPPA